MEYENLKNLQENNEDFAADKDMIDTSSQQQTERTDSISSTHSASYQIFYSENSIEPHFKESLLQESQKESLTDHENRRATPESAVYSHPQPISLKPQDKEEDEERYANTHTSSDEIKGSCLVYQVPKVPMDPLPVEQAPNSTALIDNGPGQSTIQVSDIITPAHPVRRISDSIVGIQHTTGHPVAKKSLSVSSGSHGSSAHGFQQIDFTSVAARPLIMKVLPLYLCMDNGKVYADQNAASIPTHHLIEIKGLEKSIVLQETNRLHPIPPPIITKEADLLTHPSPVYETVPRDLATYANKAAVVTDQPRIQSSPPLPPETRPSPPVQDPSRVSDIIIPGVTTSLVSEDVPNTNDNKEKVATQTPPSLMHSDHKVHEPSQASLTGITSSAAERPIYVSTSEYYGHGYSGPRLDEVHSYYYFTIVAAIVVGLCLDFVVLLAFFLPALWFSNKASNSKHSGKAPEVRKYGRRALVFNIIGGVLHVLFIIVVAIGFITGVSVSLNN